MSLKEKIQRLFKKKIITINDRSSVNAIYTASNKDLKKVTDQVNHIQDTLDNLQIPVLPDHSDFATRSQDNTFTASNTFTKAVKLETFPEISKGNYEPTANKQLTPKFYVDKKVNDGITPINERITNLNTTLLNTMDVKDQSILVDAKNYTKAEIAKIPQPDLSNLAKLDQENQFIAPDNTFERITTNVIACNRSLQYFGLIDSDATVTTRGYVTSRISDATRFFWKAENKIRAKITKYDYVSGQFLYEWEYTFTNDKLKAGEQYYYHSFTPQVFSGDGSVFTRITVDRSYFNWVKATDSKTITIKGACMSTTDCYVGGAGTYNGYISFRAALVPMNIENVRNGENNVIL